jgi:hypothetical protein
MQPDKFSWTEIIISREGISGVRGHTALIIGNFLHVFGGYSTLVLYTDGTDRLNDLWSIELENSGPCEWILNKTERQPFCRQKHSCVCLENNIMVVYGGFDGDKWLKDLYTLDLSNYEIDRLECSVLTCLI